MVKKERTRIAQPLIYKEKRHILENIEINIHRNTIYRHTQVDSYFEKL